MVFERENFFAGEKKKETPVKQAVSFYIGENDFGTKREQDRYPVDNYPIHISIDYKGEALYSSLKMTLDRFPKDRVKYRHEDYYGTRFDIFVSHVDSVRHILKDRVLKDCALYDRKTMSPDERIYPHEIMSKASSILFLSAQHSR